MSWKTIILIVVVLLAALFVGAFLLLALLGPAIGNVYENIVDETATVGEDFLLALRDADYDAAYALLHPDVQDEIAGPEALAVTFPPSTIDTWDYEAGSATTSDGDPAVAITGTLSLNDGMQFDMQIILVRVGDVYRVAGFSFQPRQ